MMKKITALLLTAAMLFSFAACGSKTEEPTGQVADIFNAGYSVSITGSSDNEIGVLLEDADNLSHIAISAEVSNSELKKFNAIDSMSANFDDEIKAFLCDLDSVTIEDLEYLVPTEEELNGFVGKTIGDIEAEGYDRWGYNWGEGEYTLIYDNGTVVMSFTVADPQGVENPDEASTAEVAALEISAAAFYDVSDCYFDSKDL